MSESKQRSRSSSQASVTELPRHLVEYARKMSPRKRHGDDGHNNNHLGKELEPIKEEVIGNIIKVDDIDVAIKTVPITVQRRPFIDRGHPKKPGVPRAFTAPSQEFTHGAHLYHIQHQNQTVLQQHVDFFDANGDGVIWQVMNSAVLNLINRPWDTFVGFHMIGFNIVLSILAVIVVHSAFSYPTCPAYLPDPFFRVWTSRIHKAIHGSDSDTYDSEGRYVPQKFEDLFSKYSIAPDRKTLHWTDLVVVHRGNRNAMDPFGWLAEAFELLALWWLLADDEGYVHKHEVRGVYDGSIFYERWEQRRPFEPWYWRWLTTNRVQGYSGSLKPGDHGDRRGSLASAKTYSTAESERNTTTASSA